MSQQVGNYDLAERIGEGGMGSVYVGVHRALGSRAAIKILHPQIARAPEMAARFLREAKAATRAEHPGIVRILDYGMSNLGLPYLAMEYLDGQPLSKYIAAHGRLSLPEVLSIGEQLALALTVAHSKNVIHRDLKPENIMRIGDPESPRGASVKVVDFGIARIDTPANQEKLTRTGSFLGTPCYMAPEVIMDPRRANSRSDVYALGIILYQMLVGSPPFCGDSMAEVVVKHLQESPPKLAGQVPFAPPRLCELVEQMLSKSADARPSMKVVALTLAAVAQAADRTQPPSHIPGARLPLSQRLLAWTIPSVLVGTGALGLTHHRLDSVRVTPIEAQTRSVPAPPAPPVIVAIAAPDRTPVGIPKISISPSPSHRRSELPLRGADLRPTWPQASLPPMARPPAVTEESNEPVRLTVSTLRNPFAATETPAVVSAAAHSSDVMRRDAERFLLDSAEARHSGNRHKAMQYARQATQGLPAMAWGYVGALGCEAGDLSAVRAAYQALEPIHRGCMEDTCRYFGIVRSGTQWRQDSRLRHNRNFGAAQLALQDAENDYREHLYDRTIEHAQLAINEYPLEAWQAIGRAACMKADVQLANRALCRLDPIRQRNIRYVCHRNHIELPLR